MEVEIFNPMGSVSYRCPLEHKSVTEALGTIGYSVLIPTDTLETLRAVPVADPLAHFIQWNPVAKTLRVWSLGYIPNHAPMGGPTSSEAPATDSAVSLSDLVKRYGFGMIPYIEMRSILCPKCGENALMYANHSHDSRGKDYDKIRCRACNSVWTERSL